MKEDTVFTIREGAHVAHSPTLGELIQNYVASLRPGAMPPRDLSVTIEENRIPIDRPH